MSSEGFMRRHPLKIRDTGKHPENPHIVLHAARHNLREIQAERRADSHIDSRRTHMNQILAGPATAAEVAALANELMAQAGVPKSFRIDGVRLVEVLFSLPREFSGDERAFFDDCLTWTGEHFGGAGNVVSAVIHRDEAQLHAHVLLVPLLDGRMAGHKLASYHRRALEEDQRSFHEAVASRHGLQRAVPLSKAEKAAMAAAVLRHLKGQNDPAMTSHAWAVIRDAIEADPRPFADALSVTVKPPPQSAPRRKRTFAEIMTSPGRGPKKEIEPYRVQGRRNDRTLPCVEFAQNTPLSHGPASALIALESHELHAGTELRTTDPETAPEAHAERDQLSRVPVDGENEPLQQTDREWSEWFGEELACLNIPAGSPCASLAR